MHVHPSLREELGRQAVRDALARAERRRIARRSRRAVTAGPPAIVRLATAVRDALRGGASRTARLDADACEADA